MSAIAIEINDAGLRASGPRGAVGAASPGYALLERRTLLTGEPARAAARLKPRFVSHHHWQRMSLETVGRPFPGGLRNADLVHAHLSDYWSELRSALDAAPAGMPVLLVIPPSYGSEQTGLLLGIARSCEMPVVGLVDAAVAAVAGRTAADAGEGAPLHVDVELHRATVTRIETSTSIRRRLVEVVVDAGRLAFERRWADHLAQRFVRETRFDPLHRGDSEQQLFDRLPAWTRALADAGAAHLELGEHTIEVAAEELHRAAAGPIESIVRVAASLVESAAPRNAVPAIFVSGRAAALPGLAGRLGEELGAPPVLLPDGAAASGALARRESIEAPGSALPLVLELPLEVSHV